MIKNGMAVWRHWGKEEFVDNVRKSCKKREISRRLRYKNGTSGNPDLAQEQGEPEIRICGRCGERQISGRAESWRIVFFELRRGDASVDGEMRVFSVNEIDRDRNHMAKKACLASIFAARSDGG